MTLQAALPLAEAPSMYSMRAQNRITHFIGRNDIT